MLNRIFYFYGILIIDFRVLRSPNETRVYHLPEERKRMCLFGLVIGGFRLKRQSVRISRVYGIVSSNEARANPEREEERARERERRAMEMDEKKMHNVSTRQGENKTALCVHLYAVIRIQYTHLMRLGIESNGNDEKKTTIRTDIQVFQARLRST